MSTVVLSLGNHTRCNALSNRGLLFQGSLFYENEYNNRYYVFYNKMFSSRTEQAAFQYNVYNLIFTNKVIDVHLM